MSDTDLQPLVSPGEILSEEFLIPLGISQERLALDTGISPGFVSEIVPARRPITAEEAVRLGLYFGMEPEFWLNLQMHFDLDRLTRESGVPEVKRCPLVPAS